jgi:hypothetical protein
MASTKRAVAQHVPSSHIAARVDRIDWAQAISDLDGQGCAMLKGLLSPDECREIAALYPDDAHFRSRIVMGRHGFGRGEYKYFSYPLPGMVAALRGSLYPALADVANRWNTQMGIDQRFPAGHRPHASTPSSRFADMTPCLCINIAFRLSGRIGTAAIGILSSGSREQTDDYYAVDIRYGAR